MTDKMADDLQQLVQQHRTHLIRNTILIVAAVLLIFIVKGLLFGSLLRVSILVFTLFTLALAYSYNRSGSANVALVLMFTSFWALCDHGSIDDGRR